MSKQSGLCANSQGYEQIVRAMSKQSGLCTNSQGYERTIRAMSKQSGPEHHGRAAGSWWMRGWNPQFLSYPPPRVLRGLMQNYCTRPMMVRVRKNHSTCVNERMSDTRRMMHTVK